MRREMFRDLRKNIAVFLWEVGPGFDYGGTRFVLWARNRALSADTLIMLYLKRLREESVAGVKVCFE